MPKVDGQPTCELFPGGVCKVCETDADCPVANAKCLAFPSGGKVCGSPCGSNTDCLSGFLCTDSQCRPFTASCECTLELVDFSLGCANQNTNGICRGAILCQLDGWSMCSAQPPSPERCDDLDNDCDGVTDEGFPTKGQPCDGPDPDECAEGKWVCSGDGVALVCDDATGDSVELCDGKDNDCDGATDEVAGGCLCGALGVVCPTDFVCESNSWCVSADGLEVYVPAGRFWMGCNGMFDGNCYSDEIPQHAVEVPGYFIDRYEVTAAEYKAWCSSGACLPSTTGGTYGTYAPPAKQDHPINYVTWDKSRDYCEAQGRRLCSESEWEKAARGGCGLYCEPDDDMCCKAAMPTYPWGEASPTCELAVMHESVVDGCGTDWPFAVGSKPAGASPYGVMDMAGNVWEWVHDCYHAAYTGAPPDGTVWKDVPADDQCSSSARVNRGGSFVYVAADLRAGNRGSVAPSGKGFTLGFRCCRSEP